MTIITIKGSISLAAQQRAYPHAYYYEGAPGREVRQDLPRPWIGLAQGGEEEELRGLGCDEVKVGNWETVAQEHERNAQMLRIAVQEARARWFE